MMSKTVRQQFLGALLARLQRLHGGHTCFSSLATRPHADPSALSRGSGLNEYTAFPCSWPNDLNGAGPCPSSRTVVTPRGQALGRRLGEDRVAAHQVHRPHLAGGDVFQDLFHGGPRHCQPIVALLRPGILSPGT